MKNEVNNFAAARFAFSIEKRELLLERSQKRIEIEFSRFERPPHESSWQRIGDQVNGQLKMHDLETDRLLKALERKHFNGQPTG